MRGKHILFAIVSLALLQPVASAEPITITGGSVNYFPLEAGIHFIAENWTFTAALDAEEFSDTIQITGPLNDTVRPYTDGQVVNLSSHALLTPHSLEGPRGFIADLTFNAGQTTLVPWEGATAGEFQVRDSVPFTMFGTLDLFDETGAFLERRELRGAGEAWAGFGDHSPFASYSFASAQQPVPEPSAMWLLGSGLAALGRAALRRGSIQRR